MTYLLNGFKVPTTFYKEVYKHVSLGVSAMRPETLYTTKSLCGDGFWDALPTTWWKWMAGRCFAHMVSYQLFPVKFVRYKRTPTKRYQLK